MALSASNTLIRFAAYAGAALAMTLATGLVYGYWTQRWGPTPSLTKAAERVEQLPQQLGPWAMTAEYSVPELIVETLQSAAQVHRTYANSETGEIVHVAIIVGPSGPTSVHTPEICFSSKAYTIQDNREERIFSPAADGNANSLWSLQFRSPQVGAGVLQVYYGWSTGGAWTASQSPRFEFGGQPLLYKIQISAELGPAETDKKSDSCERFFESLLQTYWQRANQSGA
jgi:hypothetical protein